jgi:hypothetical protein
VRIKRNLHILGDQMLGQVDLPTRLSGAVHRWFLFVY